MAQISISLLQEFGQIQTFGLHGSLGNPVVEDHFPSNRAQRIWIFFFSYKKKKIHWPCIKLLNCTNLKPAQKLSDCISVPSQVWIMIPVCSSWGQEHSRGNRSSLFQKRVHLTLFSNSPLWPWSCRSGVRKALIRFEESLISALLANWASLPLLWV